jgi:hypothetical protein
MRQLKYGGQLVPGDFIVVSFSNHLDFGWYVGDGRGGTLQYYSLRSPALSHDRYEEWLKMSDEEKSKHWTTAQFKKGFTIKSLWKSYINSVHSTRVLKLTNTNDIFTEQEDIMYYEKSKEALITLNFINQ